MINSTNMKTMQHEWIMDSGASDHMTASLKNLVNIRTTPEAFSINLPTGATSQITHIGDVYLQNGLKMANVLYVPQFHHNLLSIDKLAKDNECDVMFYPKTCVILKSASKEVKGVGTMKDGLYYLVDAKVNTSTSGPVCLTAGRLQNCSSSEMYALWHHRLGHPNSFIFLVLLLM